MLYFPEKNKKDKSLYAVCRVQYKMIFVFNPRSHLCEYVVCIVIKLHFRGVPTGSLSKRLKSLLQSHTIFTCTHFHKYQILKQGS